MRNAKQQRKLCELEMKHTFSLLFQATVRLKHECYSSQEFDVTNFIGSLSPWYLV
jgi:hypothetical protein